MHQLKPLVISSLYSLKFFDMMRQLKKKRVIILMYHRFSQKPQPFKIQQSIFENQIKFLKKKYNFISLKHYSEVLNGKRDDLPNNPIIITIDDGYRDNYTYAYPVLKKYSIPATIFLATDFISHKAWLWSNKLEYILKNSRKKDFDLVLGNKKDHFSVDGFNNWHRTQLAIFNYCAEQRNDMKNEIMHELSRSLSVDVPSQTVGDFQALTWDQIIEMSHNGIEFGSHTCSHPILSRLTNEQVKYEIVHSKNEIEKMIQKQVDLFCYPNGTLADFTPTTIDILRSSSYSAAVTTIPGHNLMKKQIPFLLKRISISQDGKKDVTVRLIRP